MVGRDFGKKKKAQNPKVLEKKNILSFLPVF